MAIKLRKTEEDKRFETRSKIRNYKSQVDRNLKKQEQLLVQAINNIKKAAAAKDQRGMHNAAQNAVRVKSAIDYLRSFALYLDNLEVTFEFIYIERASGKILSSANEEFSKRMLTDDQARQITQNIETINSRTEQLESRLEDQFGDINKSLDEFAERGGDNVDDVIGSILGKPQVGDEEKTKSEVDDLINKIMGGDNTK